MQEVTLENIFNILLQLKEDTNNLKEVTSSLKQELINFKSETNHRLGTFKQELTNFKSEINHRLDTFKQELTNFKSETNHRLDNLDNELVCLQNSFTKMEYEHSKKLDLLLDYANANIEKHEQFDKSFSQIDNKILNHDIQIEILEEHI